MKLKELKRMREFCAKEWKDKVELIKNDERYNEAMDTFTTLSRVFENAYPKGRVFWENDGLTGTAIFVSVETPLVVIDQNLQAFLDFFRKADTMEIYPTAKGKIVMALTFENCFRWYRKKQDDCFSELVQEEDITDMAIFLGGIIDKKEERIYNSNKKQRRVISDGKKKRSF